MNENPFYLERLKLHNAGLQKRRAIGIQAEERDYLRNMLSRRQLQGFVRPQLRHTTKPYQLNLGTHQRASTEGELLAREACPDYSTYTDHEAVR